ncbi:hypothetical protein H3Z82_06580 [Gelidibacter gilvus]|uniref:DUF5018 domain-containing protein n=2 Tax=Gelidibacter maritimus TaxID=2761487 RepID=A0A7W2M4D1_9FLAO|nr:hypothetical protein [Gelidibacter maritimus]
MKTTLKHLFVLTAIFSLAVSCSSDDDAPEPAPPAEVGMKSFGFYANDNPGVLLSDYVIEDITTNDISISLPNETDLTNLVASFTTTEGDVVKVGSVVQVSGTTPNDFSAAVEYLVTEGTTNEIYTVSVGKMASSVWSLYASYTEDDISDISLRINPSTGLPYVAYISQRESPDDRKMNLINYDGTAWNRIGAQDFSNFRARSVDLAFNAAGDPFVSFLENTDVREASIMTYEGGSWGYVGGAPYTGTKAGDNALAITSDNTIYGFYIHDERGDDRRSVFSKTFSGGAWSDLTITGRSGAARVVKSKVMNDVVYVAALDFGNLQSVSVYKYENGAWTTLADKMKENEENTIYSYDLELDVDEDGNVYLAYAENNGPSTDYQLRVKKYDAEASTWSTIGDLVATSQVRDFALAVNKFNVPMLLFQDDTKTPTFLPFDNDVNNWGTQVSFAASDASSLKLEVAPNGISYASFLVSNQLSLHKFDSPDNQ